MSDDLPVPLNLIAELDQRKALLDDMARAAVASIQEAMATGEFDVAEEPLWLDDAVRNLNTFPHDVLVSIILLAIMRIAMKEVTIQEANRRARELFEEYVRAAEEEP